MLLRYSGANVIAGDLGQASLPNDFAFEEYLSRVAGNELMRSHFDQVPMYIRDIIKKCSDEFGRFSGNYTALFSGLVAFGGHQVLVINLNYDTLLEQELQRLLPSFRPMQTVDDYVAPSQPVKIVKPHGSVDWFKRLYSAEVGGGVVGSSPTFYQAYDKLGLSYLDDQIIIKHGSQYSDMMSVKFDRWKIPLYPVVTSPLAMKFSDDLHLPSSHSETVGEFLPECKNFLIIGSSGHDRDVHSLLDKYVKSVDSVHFVVGPNDDDTTIPQRFRQEIGAFRNAASTKVIGGFGAYVKSSEFRTLTT